MEKNCGVIRLNRFRGSSLNSFAPEKMEVFACASVLVSCYVFKMTVCDLIKPLSLHVHVYVRV